jgi:hypothetical protein
MESIEKIVKKVKSAKCVKIGVKKPIVQNMVKDERVLIAFVCMKLSFPNFIRWAANLTKDMSNTQ